jgi:chromosome segregation ATPase
MTSGPNLATEFAQKLTGRALCVSADCYDSRIDYRQFQLENLDKKIDVLKQKKARLEAPDPKAAKRKMELMNKIHELRQADRANDFDVEYCRLAQELFELTNRENRTRNQIWELMHELVPLLELRSEVVDALKILKGEPSPKKTVQ